MFIRVYKGRLKGRYQLRGAGNYASITCTEGSFGSKPIVGTKPYGKKKKHRALE